MIDTPNHPPATPRPIEGGLGPQSIVEYAGARLGAVTYRPTSGREYRFDAGPYNKRHYVHDEDLDYFRRLPDFRILAEGRIDPEAEKLVSMKTELTEFIRAQVAGLLEQDGASDLRRPSQNRGGRPAGRAFGAKLDCWMNCGGLEAYYGRAEEAYDALGWHIRKHAVRGEYIPPRQRFASVRSHAKRKRERAGAACLWYKHPEPVPRSLLPN